MKANNPEKESRRDEVLARKAGQKEKNLLWEYWAFLREEKKWWLAPILLALLAAGAFVALGGTAAAPLIYALF